VRAPLFARRRPREEGVELELNAEVVFTLAELSRRPCLNALSPAAAREEFRLQTEVLAQPRRTLPLVVDRSIPGPAGEIRIRIYSPILRPGALPILVYYHGGGWVVGDLETHDPICRDLAAAAGCIVVAIDYRLAPEHRFPAAVEDAVAAFRWVAAHAAALGGDPARVAVGGDSAGGSLATVTARLTRDDGGPQPVFQVLVYPGTDFTLSSESHQRLSRGYLLDRELLEWFRGHYLRGPEDYRDPRASPLFAEDLRELPPALLLTAGFDPLRDEGRAYAGRLRDAGVPTELRHYPEAPHGFLSMPLALQAGRKGLEDFAAALRKAFGKEVGRKT
jgi:acetyl esterase